jgi:hypothetical protein
VTLPEEMPTNETLELCTALRVELTLPIAELVVNSLLPPLFSSEEASVLGVLGAIAGASPALAVLDSAVRRAVRERTQEESLQRLSRIGAPLRRLDLLLDGAATPDAVLRLAKSFGS